MADGNVLSPPRSSGTVPLASPRRKTNVSATGAVVGLSCSLLTFVAAFVLVWLSVHKGALRGNDTVPQETPFCCPREAAQLFGVIDQHVAPCDDFFAYVCANTIKQAIQQNAAHDVLWNVTARILTGTLNHSDETFAALQAYYRSCVTEIWQPRLRLKSAIEAILEITNTTKRMSHAHLLHFALEVQFRYSLDFLFSILHGSGETYFSRNFLRYDDYAPFCDHDCSSTALTAVNAHIGANCTLDEIFEWEKLFADGFSGPQDVSWDELRAVFGGIEADEMKAIFLKFQIDVDTVEYVTVDSKEELFADIQLVWNLANQLLSLCYALVLLVMDAMQLSVLSDATLNEPTIKSSEACEAHLYENEHLWRVTRVTALTSPEKDRQMRAIFEAMRRYFMSYEPLRRIMAAGNDTEVFEGLVSNMSLLLPVDLVLPEMKVPLLPSSGFVRNMLRLYKFEYDTTEEILRRRLPACPETSVKDQMTFMDSGSLCVTSFAYAWLSTGTMNPLLADAPVLGSRMASMMWARIYAWEWSEHTKKALKSFRECVELTERLREYGTGDDLFKLTMGLRTAAAVGAASSTGRNGKTSEWFRTKNAWSLYHMSEAQFFYGRYAYFRCSGRKALSVVNGPTRSSADFSVAFQCQKGSGGSNESGCADVALKNGVSAVTSLVNT